MHVHSVCEGELLSCACLGVPVYELLVVAKGNTRTALTAKLLRQHSNVRLQSD
jgi:hypothetical protein